MKQLIKNYSFSTISRQVTLTDFSSARLDRLQLIIDTTTNEIIYNFADASVSKAVLSGGNVFTLSQLQGGENNADSLQIIYDCLPTDPFYAQDIVGGISSLNPTVGLPLLINPTSGAVINTPLPLNAGIDSVQTYDSVDAIYSAGSPLVPGFALISTSTTGATIVAAVATKKIKVLSLWMNAADATNVKFQTSTGPADLTGLFYIEANTLGTSSLVLPYNPLGWFQTLAGDNLLISLSAAKTVGGSLLYVAV